MLRTPQHLLTWCTGLRMPGVAQAIPRERRTQLFSATMTNKVQKLQRACLVKPIKVEVSEKYSTVDTLRQQYLFVPAKYKDCYLAYVINELSGSTFMVSYEACDNMRMPRSSIAVRHRGAHVACAATDCARMNILKI